MEEAARKMEEAQKSQDPAAIAAATGDAAKAAAGVLGGGQAIAAQSLKAALPEKLAGLPRTGFDVQDGAALGLPTSQASAQYGNDDKQLRLEIVDVGGLGQMAVMAMGMVQGEKEDRTSAEKTWQEGGRTLHQRYSLRLHGLCIGSFTLLLMWATAHLQMRLGVESLTLRYLVTLTVGYLGYLLVLRVWAARLLRRRTVQDSGFDVDLPDIDWPSGSPSGSGGRVPLPRTGGGDFGGGGASGDFAEGLARSADGSALGDVAGGALEAVGSADEGAIVVVPIVAIFLIGSAVLLGAGSLAMAFFGWDALLADADVSFDLARVAQRIGLAQSRLARVDAAFQRALNKIEAQRVTLGGSGISSSDVAGWLRRQDVRHLAGLATGVLAPAPELTLLAGGHELLDRAELALSEDARRMEADTALPPSEEAPSRSQPMRNSSTP